MSRVTTLIALMVIAVIPSALAISIAEERIHILEVAAMSAQVPGECESGPPAVLILVERARFAVGDEGGRPAWVHSVDALRVELRHLKDARPERQLVVVDVDDAVSYERVVAVLDAALDVGLRAPTLLTSTTHRLTPWAWTLPRRLDAP